MAPVCVACRLSLSTLLVFVLFVLFVSSLLVYDRQTLLDLRPSAKDLVKIMILMVIQHFSRFTPPGYLLAFGAPSFHFLGANADAAGANTVVSW